MTKWQAMHEDHHRHTKLIYIYIYRSKIIELYLIKKTTTKKNEVNDEIIVLEKIFIILFCSSRIISPYILLNSNTVYSISFLFPLTLFFLTKKKKSSMK